MTEYAKRGIEKIRKTIQEIEDFDKAISWLEESKEFTQNEELKKSCDIVSQKLQLEIDIRLATFGIPSADPPSCYKKYNQCRMGNSCAFCSWRTSCLTYTPINFGCCNEKES